MKLKEKLAQTYTDSLIPAAMMYEEYGSSDVEDAYIAGFEKALELALKLDSLPSGWFEVPTDTLKNLGEEEV